MIHPTAVVEDGAHVGVGTRIWHHSHIRAGARVGDNCNLGFSVYVDTDAVVGDNVKLQNHVSIYHGVTLEYGVFVGPHTTFTNDRYPRAITPDGAAVSDEDWQPIPTLVKYGASIGANATILAGVTIGRWAMVAASALVSHDVPDYGLVVGVPARLVGYACACGHTMRYEDRHWVCPHCDATHDFPPLGES